MTTPTPRPGGSNNPRRPAPSGAAAAARRTSRPTAPSGCRLQAPVGGGRHRPVPIGGRPSSNRLTSTRTRTRNRTRTREAPTSRSLSRTVKAGALSAGLILLLAGCVKNASQDTLKAHGSIARLQNSLLFPVFWIAVGVFILIGGLVSFCLFKFRARSDDEAPRQMHGHTKAEIAWTIAPALLLAGIAIPTVKFVFDLSNFPKNAITVNVTGHRWWWQMEYTKGNDATQVDFTTASEMHIPVKEKVIVSLSSVDVIHNFWVPELAGKLYAIPGRHNKMVIEADTPGTYYGQCAEYCGTSHSNMRLRVIADTPDRYAAWVAAQEAPPASASTPSGTDASTTTTTAPASGSSQSPSAASLADTGSRVFKSLGCAACHAITGVSDGLVGPNLTHFKSRSVFAGAIFENTDNNLRLWLANPPGQKPGSVMPNLKLSEDAINQLIAYLDTLQ